MITIDMPVIKIKPISGYRGIKFVIPSKEKEDIREVTGYTSNSGLHWNRCFIYYLDKRQWIEVTGPIKVVETIMTFMPAAIDYWKPIAREGKNCVTLSVEDFKKLHFELAEKIINMLRIDSLDGAVLGLLTSEEGFNLAVVRLYDYLLRCVKLTEQANLTIYTTMIPRKLLELICEQEYTDTVNVSHHVLFFNISIQYIKATRTTRRINAEVALIRLPEDDKDRIIKIYHPEHGETKIVLPAGPELHLVALHISYTGRPE